MIAARAIALVVGYLFGMFQTGYFYGKKHGIDIRKQGSGNAGTTNTLRVLGRKAGAVTLLGDVGKTIIAVLLVHFIFQDRYPEAIKLIDVYAGFGAVLGHNFPFYLNFQGGKGIACTGGMILAVCPLAAPLCLVFLGGAIALTRYMSLGSILAIICFFVQMVVFGQTGVIHIAPEYRLEFYIVCACLTVMGVWRHRSNIVRLLNGTENKLGAKKQE